MVKLNLNLIRSKNKLQVILLISQLIFLLIFLLSHFMVWGYIIIPPSPFSQPFTALDIELGIFSMVSLSLLFLYVLLLNFFFSFFKDALKKHYKFYFILNFLVIFFCSMFFALTLFGILQEWVWESWIYLDKLVFGFYLWVFSFIISVGILLCLNFNFHKIASKPYP